jgi:hypothetical protein
MSKRGPSSHFEGDMLAGLSIVTMPEGAAVGSAAIEYL